MSNIHDVLDEMQTSRQQGSETLIVYRGSGADLAMDIFPLLDATQRARFIEAFIPGIWKAKQFLNQCAPHMRDREWYNIISALIGEQTGSGINYAQHCVSRFDEEKIPIFRQGPPQHELEEFLTAEQATWMADEITKLRKLSEWQSVVSLPPDNELVLVKGDSGMRNHGEFQITAFHDPDWHPLSNNHWYDVQNNPLQDYGYTPTHWRRLG